MLKVLLDARKLADGGIGTYLENLVSGLSQLNELQLELVLTPQAAQQQKFSPSISTLTDSAKPYSLDEYLFLGRRLERTCRSLDLFHTPHFTLPRNMNTPAVVTVHDLIHLTHPERWYYPPIARCLIGHALRNARRVIVVSEATRQELLEKFQSTPDLEAKLRVIPNAVSQQLINSSSLASLQLLERRFQLEPGYFFALFSNLKPHKGFSDLLSAYQKARASAQGKLPALVLAGMAARDNRVSVVQEGVRFLGEVGTEELAALYLGASRTIIPSLIEGFGLAALEAKAFGCPLLTRPLPSVTALVSNTDYVCKAMDLDALSEGISQCADVNTQWVARSLDMEFCERFSVKNIARQTLDVYREAASER